MNQNNQEFLTQIQPETNTIRQEVCCLATVRRVAAMLDLEPDDFVEGTPLPRGWQFILMGADTKRSRLRADGFPGLGVTMPELGLPKLMLGSRTTSFLKDIPIGSTVVRKSAIKSLTQKTTKTGPMVVVAIEHELKLHNENVPALVETQTYLLLPASKGASPISSENFSARHTGMKEKTVVPDETLLFQYSALGFNSHKIHIDRSHARNVEGFPDLVVNGGLATLLLTEFLREEIQISPASVKVRHSAPLFCGSPITMVIDKIDSKWQLQAFDNRSTLAVDIEVETNEL
jgi:3-methylfumaryl-CoA hydratase